MTVSVLDIWLGRAALITGVVDQPDGTTRVYVGARRRRVYFDEPAEAVEAARKEWNAFPGHIFV